MSSRKLHEIQGGIVRSIESGPLQCNTVVIADPQSRVAVLVDPGGDAKELLELIGHMRVKVVKILITHAHFDHCMAAAELATKTSARVYIHQADAEMFEKLPEQCKMFGVPPPEKLLAPETIETFSDGFLLGVLGGRAIHTPGHSPGSSCFYFPSLELLCSGDTLFRHSVGRSDLMGGDEKFLARSIREKIYSLPSSTLVIPGHGPMTTVGTERDNNPFVRGLKMSSRL